MAALLLLALALSMDAFAVALVRGAAGEHRLLRAIECGLAFGLAQGVMPLVGWGLGTLFAGWIEAIDHWIAFGLLVVLGLRMIREGLADAPDTTLEAGSAGAVAEGSAGGRSGTGSHVLALFAAAVATSIDAAAAGLTLELFTTPVWLSCLAIGLVALVLSSIGYWFASRIGTRLGRWAEGAGGLVLIVLGVRILVEHMG